jgi:serine/threonine protein kinase
LAYLEQHKGWLVWKSYLVTEYVDGRNLSVLEQDSNVPQQRLSIIMGQIEELLERLGKYRITHGDLKHTNILITQNGPIFTDLDSMRVHRLKSTYKFKRAKDLTRFKKDLTMFAKNNANKVVPV